MTMTKEAFLRAYKEALVLRYAWPSDQAKLDRFMASVEATLNGANTWAHEGDAVTAAWRAVGGKGNPTKKALRALASEN